MVILEQTAYLGFRDVSFKQHLQPFFEAIGFLGVLVAILTIVGIMALLAPCGKVFVIVVSCIVVKVHDRQNYSDSIFFIFKAYLPCPAIYPCVIWKAAEFTLMVIPFQNC